MITAALRRQRVLSDLLRLKHAVVTAPG